MRTKGDPAIAFIVAIIFTLIGGGIIVNNISQSRICTKKVEAVISDIDVHLRGYKTETNVYIDYSCNGQSYSNVYLGYNSSEMYEGETITISVNPDNPRQFLYKGTYVIGIIILVVGLLALAICLFIFQEE